MNKIEILYYDRIDVSEGININKTCKSKECDNCQYWYFLNKGFKFQSYVCNRCHESLMMSVQLSDIAILEIWNADYCCIMSRISKSQALNVMQNIDFTEQSRTLQN